MKRREAPATLISGLPVTDALNRKCGPFCEGVQRVMDGCWKSKDRSDIRSSGYVLDTLEAALWCVSETTTFREVVLLAVNPGDDADTVGAVTGQLAGAAYRLSAHPDDWVSRLAWSERLSGIGRQLFDASLLNQ
ncbi:ADP-ribosylglycohydrolase family protein [Methylobacterium komagatae]